MTNPRQLDPRHLQLLNNPSYRRLYDVIGPQSDEVAIEIEAAREAMRRGRKLNASQQLALARAIQTLRPSPLVTHGEIPALSQRVRHHFPQWASFRKRAKRYLPSIGRVDRSTLRRPSDRPLATCFMVAPGIVVTNSHVVDQMRLKKGIPIHQQVEVRFDQEYGGLEKAPVAITEIVERSVELDVALLRLAHEQPKRAPLLITNRMMAKRDRVAVVGYPMNNSRLPNIVRSMYDGVFSECRASPGEVLGHHDVMLLHDCTTLGGNSGSPIFALDTAKVVAIHVSGLYLARNSGLTGPSLEFIREHVKALGL